MNHKPDELKNHKHPQYGKLQNYNQNLSVNLNWLNFQLRGAHGNISRAHQNIVISPHLQHQERCELLDIVREASRLCSAVENLRARVADFNKNKIGVD